MRFVRSAVCHVALLGVLAAPGTAQLLSDKLLYNTVQPCRVLDTRGHHGPVAANTTYTVAVVGNGDLSAQGGSATGCGIPGFVNGSPQALAVMINLVAVGAQGPGDLRAYPPDQSVPSTSVINYANVNQLAGLNIANAIALPLGHTTQGQDLALRADSSGTDVVADVVGYFTRAAPRRFYISLAPGGLGVNGSGPTTACAQGFHFASIDEILNLSQLAYDASQPFADALADMGAGAPHGHFAWVRTGGGSLNSGSPGLGNCFVWASASGADFGASVALIQGNWNGAAVNISPYFASQQTCNLGLGTWCVEN